MLRRSLAGVFFCAMGAACSVVAGIDKYDEQAGDVATGDADAADAGDATNAPFCSLHADAALCADFEDANADVATGFTDGVRGDVTRTTDLVISGAGAALAFVSAGDCSYADLLTTFPGAVDEAHIEMKLRLSNQTSSPTGYATIAQGICLYIFELDGRSGQLHFQQKGTLSDGGEYQNDRIHGFSVAPQTGTWSTLAIDLVDGGGGVPALSVLVDGESALVLTQAEESLLSACALGVPLVFSPGIFCDADSNVAARLDDISVDVK